MSTNPTPAPIQDMTITIPSSLTLENCICFAVQLHELPTVAKYIFDFSKLSHTPPHGILQLARTINVFRETRLALKPISEFRAKGHTHSYAGHMGLWKHINLSGIDHSTPSRSNAYSSITKYTTSDILLEKSKTSLSLAQYIDNIASEQAAILSQNNDPAIETTLKYCLRELFRNVVEHSGSEFFWCCSQYYPKKDSVELAVADSGNGILSTLAQNPAYSLTTENQAIVKSTESGTTRIHSETVHVPGMWPGYGASENENSGVGLHVLKQLAGVSGSLSIISNNGCVVYKNNQTLFYDTLHSGVTTRLILRPKKLGNTLGHILQNIGKTKMPSKLTPSLLAKLN